MIGLITSKLKGLVSVLIEGIVGLTVVALIRYGGVMWLVIVVPTLLGWIIGSLYLKKKSRIVVLEKILVFTSLVTWVFPVVGYALSTTLLRLGIGKGGTKNKKWIIIGAISYVLALLNSGIAVFQGLQ